MTIGAQLVAGTRLEVPAARASFYGNDAGG
jgi:hypothetical protein